MVSSPAQIDTDTTKKRKQQNEAFQTIVKHLKDHTKYNSDAILSLPHYIFDSTKISTEQFQLLISFLIPKYRSDCFSEITLSLLGSRHLKFVVESLFEIITNKSKYSDEFVQSVLDQRNINTLHPASVHELTLELKKHRPKICHQMEKRLIRNFLKLDQHCPDSTIIHKINVDRWIFYVLPEPERSFVYFLDENRTNVYIIKQSAPINHFHVCREMIESMYSICVQVQDETPMWYNCYFCEFVDSKEYANSDHVLLVVDVFEKQSPARNLRDVFLTFDDFTSLCDENCTDYVPIDEFDYSHSGKKQSKEGNLLLTDSWFPDDWLNFVMPVQRHSERLYNVILMAIKNVDTISDSMLEHYFSNVFIVDPMNIGLEQLFEIVYKHLPEHRPFCQYLLQMRVYINIFQRYTAHFMCQMISDTENFTDLTIQKLIHINVDKNAFTSQQDFDSILLYLTKNRSKELIEYFTQIQSKFSSPVPFESIEGTLNEMINMVNSTTNINKSLSHHINHMKDSFDIIDCNKKYTFVVNRFEHVCYALISGRKQLFDLTHVNKTMTLSDNISHVLGGKNIHQCDTKSFEVAIKIPEQLNKVVWHYYVYMVHKSKNSKHPSLCIIESLPSSQNRRFDVRFVPY